MNVLTRLTINTGDRTRGSAVAEKLRDVPCYLTMSF